MKLPQKLIIEGQKSIEIKRAINDLIDYLTAKEEAESKKVEVPSEVNTYRMTLQTAAVPFEQPVETDVPVGTVEEITEKLVKVKGERGWYTALKSSLNKE